MQAGFVFCAAAMASSRTGKSFKHRPRLKRGQHSYESQVLFCVGRGMHCCRTAGGLRRWWGWRRRGRIPHPSGKSGHFDRQGHLRIRSEYERAPCLFRNDRQAGAGRLGGCARCSVIRDACHNGDRRCRSVFGQRACEHHDHRTGESAADPYRHIAELGCERARQHEQAPAKRPLFDGHPAFRNRSGRVDARSARWHRLERYWLHLRSAGSGAVCGAGHGLYGDAKGVVGCSRDGVSYAEDILESRTTVRVVGGVIDLPQASIGSTFFINRSTGKEIYVLGAENVDTDEFDDSVIAHEWGHYYQSSFSRDDSPWWRPLAR
jgi:hypothetical protein